MMRAGWLSMMMRMMMSMLLVSLVSCSSAENIPAGTIISAQSTSVRNPRIFFPLTTSTKTATTTAGVTTNCIYTAATLTACSGRRRRMIVDDGIEEAHELLPDNASRTEEGFDADTDIESILREEWEEEESNRDPRFMIYWTTIVKTSYTTSYTKTSTIATVVCTPSGFGISGCGK